MPAPITPSEWDLTPDEIKLIQKRAQLRTATKAEFLKQYRNPFFNSVPGHFVDPQNTRLYAYQMNSYRYLYTSPRILLAPGLFLLAGALLQYFATRARTNYNNDCNAGIVPYANRPDFNAFF